MDPVLQAGFIFSNLWLTRLHQLCGEPIKLSHNIPFCLTPYVTFWRSLFNSFLFRHATTEKFLSKQKVGQCRTFLKVMLQWLNKDLHYWKKRICCRLKCTKVYFPILHLISPTCFHRWVFPLQTLVVYRFFLSLPPCSRAELSQVIHPVSARKVIYFSKQMVCHVFES